MLETVQQNWVVLTVVGSVLLFLLPWLFVYKMIRSRKRILQSGISKQAKIIRYKPSVFKLGKHAGSEFMQGVGLWLEVGHGQTERYTVKTRSVIHVSEFSKIHKGMLVGVKVDPNDKTRVVVDEWSGRGN